MKILPALIVFPVLLSFILFQTTYAATTGTVAATVTAMNISITVSDGNVSYGTVALSGTKDTTASGVNETQTATNNGNVAEDFNISSSDATGGTAWTVSGTAIGANQYMHKYSINGGSSWTPMTTSYNSLAANIGAGANRTFDLQISTPSSTADYTQKSITVTVQAVMH